MSSLSQSLNFTVSGRVSTGVTYANSASGTLNYFSDKLKGDGYYGSSDGIHTVMYTASPNFTGTLQMQASLATDPQESDWFDVINTTVTYNSFDNRATTTRDYFNFTGNFVWVRGHIVINSGAVELIQYNH